LDLKQHFCSAKTQQNRLIFGHSVYLDQTLAQWIGSGKVSSEKMKSPTLHCTRRCSTNTIDNAMHSDWCCRAINFLIVFVFMYAINYFNLMSMLQPTFTDSNLNILLFMF